MSRKYSEKEKDILSKVRKNSSNDAWLKREGVANELGLSLEEFNEGLLDLVEFGAVELNPDDSNLLRLKTGGKPIEFHYK